MDTLIQKPRVFLSHAREDKQFIERIAADFRRCQIEYWLDKEQIRVGRPWQEVIFQDGLTTCDSFFVYLTEDALRSKMVEKELAAASVEQLRQGGVAILPYVSNSNVRRQLRLDLQILNCKAWNEENYDEMLPEVIAEIWHSYMERTIAGASMKIWMNSGPKAYELREELNSVSQEADRLKEEVSKLKAENSKLREDLVSTRDERRLT